MLDLSVKYALVAGAVWLLTRRVLPRNAAAAHQLWLVVLLTPLLWAAGRFLFDPVVYVQARQDVWPALVTAPGPAAWSILSSVYLAIAGLLLVRVAAGIIAVRRLLQRSLPLPPDDLVRLCRIAGADRLDIREADLRVPVTAGFVHAAVVLPAGWRAIGEPALRAILRHEAAHVRRRDCAIAVASALLEAVFWFNPAIWLASSRLRWFAEMACDADAAKAMDSEEYAAELLALAARWSGARRPGYAITAGAETGVARRIGLLLDEIEGGSRPRLLLPATALALLVVLPLSATVSIGRRSPRVVESSPSAAPDHREAHEVLHRQNHRHQ